VKQYLRIKRDTKLGLKEQIKNKGSLLFNDGKRPKVSFGMRIFGNELKYFTFDGADKVKTLMDLMNPKSRAQKLLNEKVFQMRFTFRF
jgi:hypothetical protein